MNRYLWPTYKRPPNDINIGDRVYWNDKGDIAIVHEIIGDVFHIYSEGVDPSHIFDWTIYRKEDLRKVKV